MSWPLLLQQEEIVRRRSRYFRRCNRRHMMLPRGLSQEKVAPLTFVWLLLCVIWTASSYGPLQEVQEVRKLNPAEELACPPCDILFSKLESSGDEGKLIQNVKVQERGEPKSGTGFMFSWAGGTLLRTCRYLQLAFGEKSCVVKHTYAGPVHHDESEASNHTLIFDPSLGGDDTKCSCNSIERVTIAISRFRKHTLPVAPTCLYAHPNGVDARTLLNPKENHPGGYTCSFADGSAVTNYNDLWRCVHEAACPINDSWHQMAVFRDPRPVAVSAFYHLHRNRKLSFYSGNVDDFVAAVLPTMTQWIAVRHMLFEGIMEGQSTSFWYGDALEDCTRWHYRWLQTIGLQLPPSMVQKMVNAALAGDFGVGSKIRDRHPGVPQQGDQGDQEVRKFENEVSPHLLAIADDALRQWLPNVLLSRLDVTP